MGRRLRILSHPRCLAPSLHVGLFAITWLMIWASSQPWLDGPGRWPFSALFLVDLQISAIAFGAMFSSDGAFLPALVAWGLLGTLWWYALGLSIEVWLRRLHGR